MNPDSAPVMEMIVWAIVGVLLAVAIGLGVYLRSRRRST